MISSEVVITIVVAAISVGLEVIPGLIEAWGKVDARWKPLVFLGLSAVVSFGFPFLTCVGITLGAEVTCAPGFTPEYINSSILTTLASWAGVSAAFGVFIDPLGKRMKAKKALKEAIANAGLDAVG